MKQICSSGFYLTSFTFHANFNHRLRHEFCTVARSLKVTVMINKTAMTAIRSSKNALRKDMKIKLNSISKEEKNRQSEIVLNQLYKLKEFEQSQRISVYLSTDEEINTEPLVRKVFKDGKLCFVPRYAGSIMEMVKLTSMEDWEMLPLTKWNIKQPDLSEKRENALESGGLDLVIVPGVAFTKDGLRLGHGKGYYDTFLNQLSKVQSHRPHTVAVAFKEQILNDIPTQNHDFKIDIVLYVN